MRQWYALYCRPRQEARAYDNLQRQGFSLYHPKLRTLKQRRAGLTPVVESLFPRYLFIHLDDQADNWAPIRSTRGVVDLVKVGGYPRPVPNHVIEQLASFQVPDGYIDHCWESDFKEGERLRVTGGPFAGNWVEFLERGGDERVVVLLNIMHTLQKVEVPIASVSR
jgi:transcriptional antiterminator RfaH